mmetsp:Transcript_964/g.2311  ORF Transcript_964/g.2311 Transcript_964/m.2311 type:complete len:205 (+) Transcript_964:3341-3955(+)
MKPSPFVVAIVVVVVAFVPNRRVLDRRAWRMRTGTATRRGTDEKARLPRRGMPPPPQSSRTPPRGSRQPHTRRGPKPAPLPRPPPRRHRDCSKLPPLLTKTLWKIMATNLRSSYPLRPRDTLRRIRLVRLADILILRNRSGWMWVVPARTSIRSSIPERAYREATTSPPITASPSLPARGTGHRHNMAAHHHRRTMPRPTRASI